MTSANVLRITLAFGLLLALTEACPGLFGGGGGGCCMPPPPPPPPQPCGCGGGAFGRRKREIAQQPPAAVVVPPVNTEEKEACAQRDWLPTMQKVSDHRQHVMSMFSNFCLPFGVPSYVLFFYNFLATDPDLTQSQNTIEYPTVYSLLAMSGDFFADLSPKYDSHFYRE